MKRHVCIHGHFYQPPRENPWLEEVELQDSAYPYHDWNQRITSECYAPNTAARILDGDERITQIVNNYTKISFNFGPTLLSWMERNDPVIYQAILQADQASRKYFSGHGSAIAQCYNHMIMPLACPDDKKTQVIWGLRDFEHRFKRRAEGMWLPETAVDLETLEILVSEGIRFTILAPNQAKAVRELSKDVWQDVSGSKINPRQPYLCRLPSGKMINLFFYDGPISRDLAFGDLLRNGENFAKRLLGAFNGEEGHQLVHISTDGETYGHHHHMGDMALAYCLKHLEQNHLARITNYGEYLDLFPPAKEVQIFENSSWSCCHGVERWRADCGCNSGMHAHWNQKWRAPLRDALDRLRAQLKEIFEQQGEQFFSDSWLARNEYIEVMLDRSQESVGKFIDRHSKRNFSNGEDKAALKILEMQRHAMLMYTSCGWFFDEVSGIETVQILQYAAKAVQLAEEVTQQKIEDDFLGYLSDVPSNIPAYNNAAYVYEKFVRPSILDLVRVGAHYAMSSLFEDYTDTTEIYSYTALNRMYDRLEIGKQKLAVGEAQIRSNITWEEAHVSFAVFHMGDHNLVGGVRQFQGEKDFSKMHRDIKESFRRQDYAKTAQLIQRHFDSGHYNLQHLFKDEQSKILYQILDSTLEDVEVSLRKINEHHSPIVQVIKRLHIPLPKMLVNTILVMLNTDLLRVLGQDEIDLERLEELVSEAVEWSLEVDKITLSFVVRRRITILMEKLRQKPENGEILMDIEPVLRILEPLSLDLDLWKAQNSYFSIGKNYYGKFKEKAERGNRKAKKWVKYFDLLGNYFKVRMR